ncbi:MAG: hypothetical protein IPK80_25765 [Nannocystis sp.]|nr:hypothetical protein [Nannocystis sp.]
MGDKSTRRQKARKLLSALRHFGDERQVAPRLRRLQELGWIEQIPTRTQRIIGAIDMSRFFIIPCADDYYRTKGITLLPHPPTPARRPRLLDRPDRLQLVARHDHRPRPPGRPRQP